MPPLQRMANKQHTVFSLQNLSSGVGRQGAVAENETPGWLGMRAILYSRIEC